MTLEDFEALVLRVCARVRAVSLELSEIEDQVQSLGLKRDKKVEEYRILKEELNKILQQGKSELGLDPTWTCILATGKLVQLSRKDNDIQRPVQVP